MVADSKMDTRAMQEVSPIAFVLPNTSPAYPMVNCPMMDPIKTVAVAELLTQASCLPSLQSSTDAVQTAFDITIRAMDIA